MATCFFASGDRTSDTEDTYIPCNQTAVENGGHSACCAPGDMCFTNGLCKAGPDNYNWNWRIGCTDETFEDPACPNYCRGIGSDSEAHLVFQCQDNETWCCTTGNPDSFERNVNFTCCDQSDLTLDLGRAVFYTNAAASLGISTAAVDISTSFASAASTTTSATVATQSTTDAATDPTSSADPSSGSTSSSLPIGLGVGIPLGLLFVAAVGYLSWRMGRRQSLHPSGESKEAATEGEYRRTLAGPMEIDGQLFKAELPLGDGAVELEGRGIK